MHEEVFRGEMIAAFHMRRGDYNSAINRATGILSLEYFRQIATSLPPEMEIWVFTDDPETIKIELANVSNFNRKVYGLDPPTDSDPIESLLLMSKASRLAISNSTFSWWAAFFADSSTVVYAPSKWFEQRPDPMSLIPDSWVRIKSEWVHQ